jgi:Raf kinase inhibitor-like YbhB/YbcL family protein
VTQAEIHMTQLYPRVALWCIAALTVLVFGACTSGSKEAESPMTIQLTSDAFSDGQPIPPEYTCTGSNASLSLKWSGAPAVAKSFVVICEDKDAPSGFIHWVVYDIPVSATGLPKQLPTDQSLDNGAKQGMNDYDRIGYAGPCPPVGTHRYVFHVYAADILPDVIAPATGNDVDKAIKGHILAQGQLIGTYKRP